MCDLSAQGSGQCMILVGSLKQDQYQSTIYLVQRSRCSLEALTLVSSLT